MVLAFAYQDEVKAKLVAELNTYLLVPVQQSGIELTLIERFPQASLALRNVFIHEVRTDSLAPDTLLFAQDLYLEFSLLSLLRGNYTVSQVHGKGVRLYAGVDHHGKENWLIFRNDTNSTGNTDLKLNKVTFDGLETRYRDARNGLDIRTASEKLALRGRFREAGSELAVTGDVHLREWRNGQVLQLSDRHAEVKMKMNFGGADGAFRLEKGSEVLTGEVPVAVTMAVERGANGLTLDLRASGFNMALGGPGGPVARIRTQATEALRPARRGRCGRALRRSLGGRWPPAVRGHESATRTYEGAQQRCGVLRCARRTGG